MVKRPIGLTGLVLLVLGVTGIGRPALGADAASCGDCHEQSKTFGANPHGRAACELPGDAACASCHGDGKAHMEAGGDKSLIRGLHGAKGAETCVTCHDVTTEHTSFIGGVHGSSVVVNCLTCHSIHSPVSREPKLLAKGQTKLCASCHQGQTSSMESKAYTHRLDRGGFTCASCHNPHGRAGEGMLKQTAQGELPCLTCHNEKRGPYVYEHVGPTTAGMMGGCLTCHEPHGSNNPKMLTRSRIDMLCLECHSALAAGPVGSQPPATHNLLLPRWRNCTTCHVAVHGSNRSPKLLK
jgi:DmsE family decaheme c-type cytochrome